MNEEAILEQITIANKRLNSTMESYQKLLCDLQEERAKAAYYASLVEHIGYGMMVLMQKHRYDQIKIPVEKMRLNVQGGYKLDLKESEAKDSVNFAIVQQPFNYEDHVNEVRKTTNSSSNQ